MAQSPCDFKARRLVLRTAIHCGVKWILCPDTASQCLAGRALYDLRGWRSAILIGQNSLTDSLRGAAIRLRRDRVDLAVLTDLSERTVRAFSHGDTSGELGSLGAFVDSAPSLIGALRETRISHASIAANFTESSFDHPAVRDAIAARTDVTIFAPAKMRHAPYVGGITFAPTSPRGLIRHFASLNLQFEGSSEGRLANMHNMAKAA